MLFRSSELVFGMENLGIEYEEMHKRYEMTVEDLKLQKLCGKNIFSLSGGEKQSIAFGGVYALSPEIYVLDEPSANLDKKAVKNLEKTLLRLKNKGKTIIVSEHRLYYLKDIADRLVMINDGKITKEYTMSELSQMTDDELHEKGLRSVPLRCDLPCQNCIALCRSEERCVGKECRSRWSPYH